MKNFKVILTSLILGVFFLTGWSNTTNTEQSECITATVQLEQEAMTADAAMACYTVQDLLSFLACYNSCQMSCWQWDLNGDLCVSQADYIIFRNNYCGS